MKYAIVSDLHANLQALERVLADAARFGVERIVCLGDVVGYGPLPSETLRRIRETADLVIAGNHDDAVSGRINTKNFIDLAGDAVTRHHAALSRDELAWLRGLPHTAEIDGAVLTHGDLTEPESYLYIDTEDAAAANFAATDAPLVFVGHTHLPGIYLTGQSGCVYTLKAEDIVLEDGKRYIVNVGSVGYPRESGGLCYSSYVLYDTVERTVRFRKLAFAVSSVLQRGRAKGLNGRHIGATVGLIAAFLLVACAIIANGTWRKPTTPVVKPATSEPTARQEEVKEEKTKEEEKAKDEEKRTLALDSSKHLVRANLKLERDSPAAQLTIIFFCGSNRCALISDSVIKKNTRKFAIPKGATRVVFSVQPMENGGAQPVIKDFSPVAE